MAGKLAISGGQSLRGGRAFPVWPRFGQAESAALQRVLESGVWGINSKEIDRFEHDFAAYQGCRYGVSMCNGSVTLRSAILACGVESGDEIIVPPYTFLATVTSVIEANCVPVFVDIDPATYCMNPALIEAKITPRTRAIIPVHIAGNAAEMDAIMAIARKHQLTVIEDAAHAVGAEYKGRRIGSLGDLGSFSFQSSKNLCAGEGGAIVSNDESLADRCWSIHNCGRDRAGAWYEHNHLGGNYRLGAFQAGVLNAQLTKVDAELEIRNRNAVRLIGKLQSIPGVRPLQPSAATTRHAWHLFVIRYSSEAYDGLDRARWLKALMAEGVPICAGYDTPQYRHAFMRQKSFVSFDGWRKSNPKLDYRGVECPVCERASTREGSWITQNVLLGDDRDIDDIADAFAKVYEHRGELIAAGGGGKK